MLPLAVLLLASTPPMRGGNTAKKPSLQKRDELERLRELASAAGAAPAGIVSMEEIVRRNKEDANDMRHMTPAEILADMKQGNARFWMGVSERPEMSPMERRALIMQQTPKVAILGCSDSRVPIEIVFDQGLGDVFVIRVAGNFCGVSAMASLEVCRPQDRPFHG